MSVHEVDCLLESMDSVVDLLGQLDDADWRVPSLCPAWQVRHVVAHLDGIEEALTGWRPAGDAPAPFEIVGNGLRRSRRLVTGPAPRPLPHRAGRAAERVARRGRRRCSTRCRGPPSGSRPTAGSWPSATSTSGSTSKTSGSRSDGPATPADRPPNWPSTRCDAASGTSSANAPPYPTAPACSSSSHGPIEGHLGAVVDGRARVVDDLDHPDAIVRTDSLTFMLLACGRIDPETHLANGDVELRGNNELAGQLARNLRFTI